MCTDSKPLARCALTVPVHLIHGTPLGYPICGIRFDLAKKFAYHARAATPRPAHRRRNAWGAATGPRSGIEDFTAPLKRRAARNARLASRSCSVQDAA